MHHNVHTLNHIHVLLRANHHIKLTNHCKILQKLGKICNWPTWVMLIIGLVATTIGFGFSVLNYWSANGPRIPLIHTSGSGSIVPHTSRIIPLSGLYCDSVILSRYNWDNSPADLLWNATIRVVFEEPSKKEFYHFFISDELLIDQSNPWHMRQYYLHNQSQITINSCFLDQKSWDVQACIIKGKKTFKKWLSNGFECTGPRMRLYSLDDCDNETTSPSHSYNVSDNDDYHIIHYMIANSSGKYNLSMNVSVSSFDYSDIDSNISCTCSQYNFCKTQHIPLMKSRGIAIVTAEVNKSFNADWSYEDSIKVSWQCKPSWIGFILVIGIPGISVFIIYLLIKLCYGMKGHKYCLNIIKQRCGGILAKLKTRISSTPPPETQRLLPTQSSDELKIFKRKFKITVSVTAISFVLLPLFVTFMEGILPVLLITTPSNLVKTSGGTHLFNYDKFFCSSLSVDISGSTRLSATAWLTSQKPNLTNITTSITGSLKCNEVNICYEAWRFYLHAGSDVFVQAANYGDHPAYFIKFSDEDIFKDFLAHPLSHVGEGVKIDAYKNINIPKLQGDYIFVMVANHTVALLDFSLEFIRVEYTASTSWSSRCDLHSYANSSCKLSVPLGAGKTYGLIQVSSDKEDTFNNSEYLRVDTQCNYRASTWAVLWLPFLILNTIISYSFFVLLFRFAYKKDIKRLNEAQQQRNIHRATLTEIQSRPAACSINRPVDISSHESSHDNTSNNSPHTLLTPIIAHLPGTSPVNLVPANNTDEVGYVVSEQSLQS